MTILTATEARRNLFFLIDVVSQEHEPIIIKGKRNKAVLVSEKDWRAIQETMYLISIPGMKESIIEGGNTPITDCYKDLDW